MAEGGIHDRELWDLIEKQMPVRSFRARIAKHTIVDQKSPFVLYAIELQSNFSKCIVKKKFDNFIQLQTNLLSMHDQIVLQP